MQHPKKEKRELLSHLHGGSQEPAAQMHPFALLSHLHGGSLDNFFKKALFIINLSPFSVFDLRFFRNFQVIDFKCLFCMLLK